MKHKVIFSFLLLIFIFSSCGEYDRLEIERKAKRTSDSLFRAEREAIVKESDSLCDLHYEKYYTQIRDSLFEMEVINFDKLINK